MSEKDGWARGGKKAVLDTYVKLHERKLGAHWIWCALAQIANGESERSVLEDFGYRYAPNGDGVETSDDRWRLSVLASFAYEVLMGAIEPEDVCAKARLALERTGLLRLDDVVVLGQIDRAKVPQREN